MQQISADKLDATSFLKRDYPLNYERTITIWGSVCTVAISPIDKEEFDLAAHLPQVSEVLQQINNTQKECYQAIVDDGMVHLAEKWVVDEAHKMQDEAGEYYLTEEGARVYVPIALQDFLKSLELMTIGFIYFDDDRPLIELYIGSDPDYFTDHVILCRFDSSKFGGYKCCGLEG